MQIGNFMVWCSSGKAAEMGCTHHARLFGLIPGFFGDADGLWISRSDLLIPLEELICFLWATLRRLRREEPDFMFILGPEISNEGMS